MLEYSTVDKSGVNITKILFLLLKVEGKTKLLALGRYFISRWLLWYIDFTNFHFFPIFRFSTIFLIFSDTWIVFSGKFYIEQVFLGSFLTEFGAGTAKYQNFSENIFFIFYISIVTWNCAQKFPIPFGSENFCEVLCWSDKYRKIYSANLGTVGWIILLTWRGITQI